MGKFDFDPMSPFVCRVARFTKETHDTFTLDVEPARGEAIAAFKPGQFNMLYVFGAGEVPISISGDPSKNKQVTHTVRAVGNVTHLLSRLQKGDALGLRGPFGNPWPLKMAQGKDVVLVAGGIGLAPLRPVVYQILRQREHYRRVALLYGTRSPEDILYKKELKRWRSEFDLDVQVTVDRADAVWRGSVDVVTAMIPRVSFDPGNTLAMVCGPEVMMHFTMRALRQRGMKNADIFIAMERNMKCAVGFCGHCQYGARFICKDGPVFRYDKIEKIFRIAEV